MNPADFTRQAAELVAQNDRVPTQREPEVSEVTEDEARALCLREIESACVADSLEHMVMHLESAVIWARGANFPTTS